MDHLNTPQFRAIMEFYSFYFKFPQFRKIPDDKMPTESQKTEKHRPRTDRKAALATQNSSHGNFQVEIKNSPAVSFFGKSNISIQLVMARQLSLQLFRLALA